MLKSGKVKNLTEIAALEGVDNSYVSRMVNLTRWLLTSSRRFWRMRCQIT
jgi:hypothetical protein